MKYLPLLLKNLFRKKLRTLLTVGSFAIALFLFGLLAIVRTSFAGGVDVAGVDRLVTINRVSLIQPLPLSYRDQIAQIPGVKAITYASWFGGVYQDEKNFFAQFAIDLPTYRAVFPEFQVADDQWKQFESDREGCVVGAELAKRFHWKVGDRVPIRGTIFPGTWEFNIRGIYRGKRDADDNTQFWFRSDYLEERRTMTKGTVGWYTVKIDDPDRAAAAIKAIDARFANSAYETKTDTEKAFAAGFVKQMGNIGLLVTVIGSVVFFTLLLVTANTVAMAVRERTRELAILKALGFSDPFVLTLVLAEAMVIALAGGVLGLGAVKLMTLGGDPTHGLIQFFFLKNQTIATGLGLALGVGFLAGILPALTASRLRVVDALRRV
jgi:putative ABC transport system permease protein